ncbi:hypothetical protein LPB03_08800 [Polaribacter vadi]|jgi:uncharacterized membrane protein YgdD (TMEM256/DUF423 family)|uniref:DUF423 domain-containing protein n=1 Tax=Polaribacter vadi TaxID=1774273 RepID=A0A1B8U3V6_9FLAO|nr:DUF423 domain-containing protein [Polaribacter vadi]AOW17558.1 hypothetical protein LPB03_08800 [Polaribacter vadi]OBY66555.1 hypothetical protein LPB3_00735 [Polaribacter vadi]|tara:strand:+ start:1000 stop:1377 length:378 start_codon:yes stop_codon:yes gene_type:complete
MSQLALIFGSLFGGLAIILGAFGAHLLKKKLTSEQLQSFETGVKYQMYHAIVLLLLGFHLDISATINAYIVYSFIIGTILFSFSIYGLVLSSANNKKLKFLGPITPLGGLFLVAGWVLLLFKFLI